VVPIDGVSQNVPPQDKAPGRGSGMALLAGYQTDAAFAGKLYPKTVGPSPSTKPAMTRHIFRTIGAKRTIRRYASEPLYL